MSTLQIFDERAILIISGTLSILCALVSMKWCFSLHRRAFPEHYARQFAANGTTIHFMAVRSRYLLCASMMNVLFSGYQSYFFLSLLAGYKASFMLSRIVYMVLGHPIVALFTYTSGLRCGITVMHRPILRSHLLILTRITCFVFLGITEAGTLFNLIDFVYWQDPGISVNWLDIPIMHPTISIMTVMAPVFIIATSAWLLHKDLSPENKSKSTQSIFLDKPLTIRQPCSTQVPISQPKMIALADHNPSKTGNTKSEKSSVSQTKLDENKLPITNGILNYPVTRTFQIMSVFVILGWIIDIGSIFVPSSYVCREVVHTIILTFQIAVELSFERILRFLKARNIWRRQTTSSAFLS